MRNTVQLPKSLLWALRYLYSPLVLTIGILALPFILLRPRGRMRAGERFGILPAHFPKRDEGSWIWFHGASQGEIAGFAPLIAGLRSLRPELHIFLTATSPTALENTPPGVDLTLVFPLDVSFFHANIFRRMYFEAIVFGEAEIWPAWLAEISVQGIPCFLVNARMSARSCQRYERVSALSQKLLAGLTEVFVGDADSLPRWKRLLPDEIPCALVGNTKYDRTPSVQTEAQKNALRVEYVVANSERPLLMLASLWPGEEEIWFPVLEKLFSEGAEFYCIVAPRHAERFAYFAEALSVSRLAFVRRSQNGKLHPEQPLLLLDSIGELEPLFSISDAAFIGATLVDKGGHNPLEAAAYACCPLLGPYGFNIKVLREQLQSQQAFLPISSAVDAEQCIQDIMKKDLEIVETGRRAQKVWQSNQGATARVLKRLGQYLELNQVVQGEMR